MDRPAAISALLALDAPARAEALSVLIGLANGYAPRGLTLRSADGGLFDLVNHKYDDVVAREVCTI